MSTEKAKMLRGELNDSILVGDVGGTKSIFALTSRIDADPELENLQTFASNEFSDFHNLLRAYLSIMEVVPEIAVFAVAGPVLNERAGITNLPWQLDAGAIATEFGFNGVRLINDLEAMACLIPHLAAADVVILQDGDHVPGGTIALIAPGTGLGEAFATWNGASYDAHATEGGHADFAPCGEEQERLLAYLRNKHGHVSVERVCSGTGLANIHRFLVQEVGEGEDPVVQSKMDEVDDITPILVAAALSEESRVCEHAVRIFVDSLAAEAGNLALTTLATGGVFLGGDLPMRMLPLLQSTSFIDRFASKGRFSGFLGRIPVSILRDPLSPLRGAGIYGLRMLRNAQDHGTRK
ncbi:glucokinase [Candidatus Bipolaricaulota bacterium]